MKNIIRITFLFSFLLSGITLASSECHDQESAVEVNKQLLKAATREEVQDLIKRGAHVNYYQNGTTPLIEASKKGRISVVKALLENNADPTAETYSGRGPLFCASENGHEKVVEALLEYISNPDLQNTWGESPLFYAAEKGHEQVVKTLLKNEADPDLRASSRRTPLHNAAKKGREKVVEILLKNKADPNAQDENGWTPLHYSSWKGHEQVVETLLQNKADPKIQTKDGTPGLLSIYKRVLEIYFRHGGDPNFEDEDGNNLLYIAVKGNHVEMAEVCLKNGANPNIRSEFGELPIFIALKKRRLEMFKQLLFHSTLDVNIKDYKEDNDDDEVGHSLEEIFLALKSEAEENLDEEVIRKYRKLRDSPHLQDFIDSYDEFRSSNNIKGDAE